MKEIENKYISVFHAIIVYIEENKKNSGLDLRSSNSPN